MTGAGPATAPGAGGGPDVLAAVAPVPVLPAHSLLVFLLGLGALLLVALLLGRLATRCGLPAVVGELVTGILLGPTVLGAVAPGVSDWFLPRQAEQFHLLDAVGQLGVLLLVGLTGVEVDVAFVRRRGGAAARISLAGLLLPLGLGVATAYLLPGSLLGAGTDREVFALFLGVAMCVSAIPVIAKTLLDMKLLHRNIGQLTLAAGVIDDICGWLLLSVVSALATTGVRAGTVLFSVCAVLGFVLFAALVGRPASAAVLRAAGRADGPGPLVATTVVLILLGAAVTQSLGLEAVFGAFVVGFVIGSVPGLDRERLAPLRTTVLAVLAPIFFASAGLRMDLTALADAPVLAAALAVIAVAILGKFTGAFLGAWSSRLNRWEALALGAGMNARGVIEVVVATVGLRLGVLNTATYTIVVLVAVVTSVMAPPILRRAMSRVEQTAEEELRRLGTADHSGAADLRGG